MLTRIDKAELLERVDATRDAKPCLVMFSSKYCGPCKIFEPVVERVTKKAALSSTAYFDIVNESIPRFKRGPRPRISSLPTLILFKRGRVSRVLLGATTHEELAEWLERALRRRRSSTRTGSIRA